MTGPVRVSLERDGQLLRLTLARPKANVLDAAMVSALRQAIHDASPTGPLKLIVIDADGPHFSFGASVEEHLPESVNGMLTGFHALFRELEGLGVPTAAVVRGQCLGGGFELATATGRVFCDESARFAVPEIRLGVFPPVAAVTLPWRVRGPDAINLILSGSIINGQEAARLGVADVCAEDPAAALLTWFETDLGPRSAVALRYAWRATRRSFAASLGAELDAAEKIYLNELMSASDPVEGLRAFLERRAPTWRHR